MTVSTITSRRHPVVQHCRRLATGRGEPGRVLLDGEHLVNDAMAAGVPIEAALVDDRHTNLLKDFAQRGIAASAVTADVMAAASPVKSPSGIVAIARWEPAPFEDVLARPGALPLVGLVDVQDPGNVGTIIRSADAFGAAGVLVLGASATPANWRTLRAAMGSTFRLPIAVGDSESVVSAARGAGLQLIAATASGGISPDMTELTKPSLLLIGSEGAGLPDWLLSAADVRVTLPMRAGIESLNAATTGSVLLWELWRRSNRTGARP